MDLNSKDFRMADRLAGGRLVEILADGRAAGRSYDAIARHLFADFGIEVTRQTLANWATELGVDKGHPEPEAATA